MYFCKQGMERKMKWTLFATFLLLVGCASEVQLGEVRFSMRNGAYPAGEWTLMGVYHEEETPLWVNMTPVADSTQRQEWQVETGERSKCVEGLYLPPVPAGRYLLQASTRKGGTPLAEAVITRADTVMIINCSENFWTYGNRGYLLDAASGIPVVGAEVRLKYYENGELVSTTVTDSMGAFRFDGLQPYRYYLVEAGTQEAGFSLNHDRFGSYERFGGDTVQVVCEGFVGDFPIFREGDSACVDTLHLVPNDFGVGEAVTSLSGDYGYFFPLGGADTGFIDPNFDPAIDFTSLREIKNSVIKNDTFFFRVENYSREPFETRVRFIRERFAVPQPWRMNYDLSMPVGSHTHHSMDSAEFAHRYPYLLMDPGTWAWPGKGEVVDTTIVDVPVSDKDGILNWTLPYWTPGLYRITAEVPQPEGEETEVTRFYYRTFGFADGTVPFYIDYQDKKHALGDTLRIGVGSCYPGVTVICEVEVNGRKKETRRLLLNEECTTLELPLLQRGVTQVRLLSLWHGEFYANTVDVTVGRTQWDWYWNLLFEHETYDVSGQCIENNPFRP